MTNETCLQTFRREHEYRLEDGTLTIYMIAIRGFLEFAQTNFDQITARDIRNWLLALEQKSYAPPTINLKFSALKAFYKFCFEERFVNQNPTRLISPVYIPEQPAYYLQYEELRQLQQLVEQDLEQRARIELLYTAGMRIGELVAIRKEDINWEERFILIPNGKRKKARIVCFTRKCTEYLTAFLNEQPKEHPYVFMNNSKKGPACIRTIQLQFNQYSEALGFSLTPHTLRHTFAAHLAQKGMPLVSIQTLLGHESAQQTQHYARLYQDARKDVYDEWME